MVGEIPESEGYAKKGVSQTSLPPITWILVCLFPLKPDAAPGVAYPIPRCNEVVLHKQPEMVSAVGTTGACLPEHRKGSRTGHLIAM
jgi:hypothetical protein